MPQPHTKTALKEVHPTGTYPADVASVQQAVDDVANGGTVLLKATDISGTPQYFHFGDDASGRGGVNVRKDVVILGESLKKHAFTFPNAKTPVAAHPTDRTVIYGGRKPLHCDSSNATATSLTVRNLYFAFPSQSAVQVKKSSGLEVSRCVIYDIKTDVAHRDAAGHPTLVVAVAIEATGLAQAAPVLEGAFKVFDNDITRREDFEYDGPDSGIVVQLARMNADIRRNRIAGFSFAGIGIDANAGEATVEKNDVEDCGYGLRPESCGIGVRRSTQAFLHVQPGVTIRDNTIACGQVAGAGGTVLLPRNGINLAGASGVTVKSNTITGSVSSDGIRVRRFIPADPAQLQQRSTTNTIEGNDLKGLVAGRAQEWLDLECDANTSAKNTFGPVALTGSGVAGVLVESNDNRIAKETFFGDYPGTTGSPQVPCVRLAAGTRGNTVEKLERAGGFPALDVSTQVRDDGSNIVGQPVATGA